MKKKIIGIIIVGLFFITVFGNAMKINPNNDILDQKQTRNNNFMIFYPPQQLAQSFIPSLNTLSKVELYLVKSGNPSITELIISIKESQSEESLVIIEKAVSEISEGWMEFDFEDITVTPGETYYIVCNPIGEFKDIQNVICWGFSYPDPYSSGTAWAIDTLGGDWREIFFNDNEKMDFCFKTYARNNAPEKPSITGETNGKSGTEYKYNFVATDPEGNDIEYCIDWGDNTSEVCIGPYISGTEGSANHTWSKKGEYAIKVKARDSYGAESEWATLDVSMPKNRLIINPIIEFLQNHPILFQLVRNLLDI